MEYYELTAIIIIWLATSVNVAIWTRYINKLLRDIRNGNFIYDDKAHSQKHLWITGVMMTISWLMFFNMLVSWEIQYSFWEHMLYNLACIFMFYPHLVEEK